MCDLGNRSLVVGYGNTLRTDDGVGFVIAEAIAADDRFEKANVVCSHQLVPELAIDLSESDVAVFVDASDSAELAPGERIVSEIKVLAGDLTSDGFSSHHVSPETLLTVAATLYGHTPRLFVVEIGVQSVEEGENLTASVQAVIPEVLDQVYGLFQREVSCAC